MSNHTLVQIIVGSWIAQFGFALGFSDKRPWTTERVISILIALPSLVASIWLVARFW